MSLFFSPITQRGNRFFYLRTVKKKKKKKKNEEERRRLDDDDDDDDVVSRERIRLDVVDDDEEEAFECGSGAYRDENGIARASKIGAVCVKDIELEDDDDDDKEEDEITNEKTTKRRARKKLVEVLSAAEREDERSRVRLPEVNDVVFAKCVKIRDKMAQLTSAVRRETFENGF